MAGRHANAPAPAGTPDLPALAASPPTARPAAPPAPASALAKLYAADKSQPLYPVAFLTNGGGVTERVKAHQLSEWLGVHVHESQVCAAHVHAGSEGQTVLLPAAVVLVKGPQHE